MATGLALGALPHTAALADAVAISWDDLIPPGIPYSEIIGAGDIDEVADTWKPVFDENATKLNPALDGAYVRMPGYITPLDISANGLTYFILVPYLGACIHVPPPPPNQLVFVTTKTPWPVSKMDRAIWVTGWMRNKLQTTALAEIGYQLEADQIEVYQ